MQLKKIRTKTRDIIAKHNSKKLSKKRHNKQNRFKKNIQHGSAGEQDLNSSLLNYYYYSSHNSELITAQLTGFCSTCVIDDFINNNAQSIGGCIELDLRNVKSDSISVDHYCKNAGLDFETILNKLIEKYNSFSGTKYPLIISIDANGITKPANTEDFGALWSNILNSCFANHTSLRPDSPITKDTKMSEIMEKILFRWDYSTVEKPKDKDLIKNESTTQPLTRINIVKNPLSKTIAVKSVNFNESVLEGIEVKAKLIRLYPKTPIFSSAFNYNFTEYLLNGVQMAALNLNLNNKYTLAYNEFFKYNKVIKIPDEIYNADTNIIKKMAQVNGDEESTTSNIDQQKHYCSEDITKLLIEALNTSDYDTAYKQVNDLISIIKEGCSDIDKVKVQKLNLTHTVPNSTLTYNLSINNYDIILSKADASDKSTVTLLGGADIQKYNISVVDSSNIKIRKYRNIFDSVNNDVYMHYGSPFDIFNIVYVNVTDGTDRYIGCLNMSLQDLSQSQTITLHKKETYLKSSSSPQTHKLHRSSSETSMQTNVASGLASGLSTMFRRTSEPDISQPRKNSETSTKQVNKVNAEQCTILPVTKQVAFKFEKITTN